MTCFGGYDPTDHPEREHFYMNATADLTIYGHTIDGWLMRNEPLDLPGIRELRIRGREFACWHSRWCPDGELGSNDAMNLRVITYEHFRRAQETGWPFRADLASATPAVVITALNKDTGEWETIHKSTEGRPSE